MNHRRLNRAAGEPRTAGLGAGPFGMKKSLPWCRSVRWPSPVGVVAGFRPALAVSALLSLLGAGAAVAAGRHPGGRGPLADPALAASGAGRIDG